MDYGKIVSFCIISIIGAIITNFGANIICILALYTVYRFHILRMPFVKLCVLIVDI